MTIMFLAHSDDITEMNESRHRGELQNGAITSVHSLNKAARVQGQMKNPSTIWRTKKNRIIVQTYAELKPESFGWLLTPENVNSRKRDICLSPKFRPHLFQIIPIYGEERGRKKVKCIRDGTFYITWFAVATLKLLIPPIHLMEKKSYSFPHKHVH